MNSLSKHVILYLEDRSRYAISLLFLGSAYLLRDDFAEYSGVNGPILDPNLCVGFRTKYADGLAPTHGVLSYSYFYGESQHGNVVGVTQKSGEQ